MRPFAEERKVPEPRSGFVVQGLYIAMKLFNIDTWKMFHHLALFDPYLDLRRSSVDVPVSVVYQWL